MSESANRFPVAVVGAPLRLQGKLFNCAVVVHAGGILGVVTKSYLQTTANFTNAAILRQARRPTSSSWGRKFRSGRTCCIAPQERATSLSMPKSARTFGCRSHRTRKRPWLAQKFSSIIQPATSPSEKPKHAACFARRAYSLGKIKHWLMMFAAFRNKPVQAHGYAQRPKISSGGSLSPRGDWRASSDAFARVWLEEFDDHIPDCEGGPGVGHCSSRTLRVMPNR